VHRLALDEPIKEDMANVLLGCHCPAGELALLVIDSLSMLSASS
jgi:hypothetical protein